MTKSASKKTRAAVAVALLALIASPSIVKIGSFFYDTLFMGSATSSARLAHDRLFPKTMDDLKEWAQSDLARDCSARERDAGPALNRKLEWKGDLSTFELEPLATPDGPALMSACENFPECGVSAFAPLNLATNAYDIFSQAMEFDHWNANLNSPIETLAKAAPRSARLSADSRKPTADLRRMRGLARAYLLSATQKAPSARDGGSAALASLTQVEHFGKLLLTQQTAEGTSAGVAILDDARAAYDAAVADGALDPSTHTPVASEELRRIDRLAKSLPSFFDPLVEPAQLGALIAADRIGAFACIGAARQFNPANAALLSYAEPTVPGEVDYRPYSSVATKVLAPSSPCQLPYEREVWTRRGDIYLAELDGVRAIPWLRRSYFLLHATNAAGDVANALDVQ